MEEDAEKKRYSKGDKPVERTVGGKKSVKKNESATIGCRAREKHTYDDSKLAFLP
jgi:hypothetical protein